MEEYCGLFILCVDQLKYLTLNALRHEAVLVKPLKDKTPSLYTSTNTDWSNTLLIHCHRLGAASRDKATH